MFFTFLRRGLAAIALALCSLAAQAADVYPSKQIRIIVGFPPGGGNDIVARVVGQKLSERLGQPILVENKPGANAIIATEYTAKAAPDGYTLMVGAIGAMVFNVGLYDKLPYDPIKDFTPITFLSSFPILLAVNPSVPAANIKELIALAKSKPGQMNFAAGSTPFQVVTELFKKQTRIDMPFVPYKGSAQSVNAAVAGDVSLLAVDLPPATAMVKAGRLRPLAVVTSGGRSPVMPDVPTMTEAGIPNFEHMLWNGLFAPAGTPPEIIAKLQKEIAAVLKESDVREKLLAIGFETGGQTPAEAAALHKADLEKWVKVVREAGLKAE